MERIQLSLGRHSGQPGIQRLPEESGKRVNEAIIGKQPDPLLKRLEVVAERWTLAGTMPNLL